MNISVKNFKSIKSLHEFEIRPFTILSGVNSAGKSSFIQLLLLLKQTNELSSTKYPIYLAGDLFKVKNFTDILFEKQPLNKLEVSFHFEKNELSKIESSDLALFSHRDDLKVQLFFQFDIQNNRIFVQEFSIQLLFDEGIENQIIKFTRKEGETYKTDTNTNLFSEGIWNETAEAIVNFVSFFPSSYEVSLNGIYEQRFLKIDWAKKLANRFINNISYIGPLREQPKEEYFISDSKKNVGIRGEYVAQVLEENSTNLVTYKKIDFGKNKIFYVTAETTLIEAVKYWMCTIFDVASDIQTKKVNDYISINLINDNGFSSNIRHVGFGISQLLPIVVEGLLLPKNGTLILEQPEIHLHPKLQCLLFDFLYSLTLSGKTIIVETHSSHFITRMRRRIAEDASNKMDDRINLTFIENNNYRTIELDDYGTLGYYPKDFIEPSNEELRAIVNAQMKKRTTKNQ